MEGSSADGYWGRGAMWGEEGGHGRCVEVADKPGEVIGEPQEGEDAGQGRMLLGGEGSLEVYVVDEDVIAGAVGMFKNEL